MKTINEENKVEVETEIENRKNELQVNKKRYEDEVEDLNK